MGTIMKPTPTFLTTFILAPFAALLCSGASAVSADFVLVDAAARIPPAPIIIPKEAPASIREATQALADYVRQICGTKPGIVEGSPTPLPDRAIWVGLHPELPRLMPGVKLEFAHPEETLIAIGTKHVIIAGRDRVAGEKQLEAGTANAVFTFLQKDLGVRWLWPGPLGTDILKQERVSLAATERRFHPPFRHRLLWPRSPIDWHRAHHLQIGSLEFDAGHAFTDWWARYHDEHSDYFAQLPDGTRKPRREPATVKLCVSNPTVAAQWLANAENAFKSDSSRVMLSAAPNDGDGFCVCLKCRAMDHPDGPPVFGYVALTDRYVKFWNRLARGLRDRFPGREVWVGTYAYSAYRTPPIAETLEPNIALGYVGSFPFVNEGDRHREKQQWLGWAKQAKAMVYRPNLFHYSGGFIGMPCLALRRTMEDFRFLAENQCVGIEVDTLPQCWGTQGVQNYLMAELAYDPMQDGEALLRDYCDRAFGPAANEMGAYFTALEEGQYAVLERVKMSSSWAREATDVLQTIYNDAFWSKAEVPLLAAEATVANAPEIYQQRVDFVRTGHDGAKLQIDVLRAMKLVRSTWGRDPEAIRRADEVCSARDKVFSKYNGLAIKRANWYVDSRRMADYLEAPSAVMREGKYVGPGKAPDMTGRD